MEELGEEIVFVVDGDNVIGSASSWTNLSDFPDDDLKEQRQWLFDKIKKFVEKNIFEILPNGVFIVFDGVYLNEEQIDEKINIVFTDEKEIADCRIVKIIKSLKGRRGKKKVFLVTSDQKLTEKAMKKEGRGLTLVAVNSSKFIDWII